MLDKERMEKGGWKESPSKYTTRSHTCGELTAELVGAKVELCGWITYKRLKGKFLVLRDIYGTTQLIVPKTVRRILWRANVFISRFAVSLGVEND
jgi:aspartyl-tRNA synthetase